MRWRRKLMTGLVGLVACLGLVLMPWGPVLACSAYDDLIRGTAARYGVPEWLIKGLIAAESGFQADAYRPEPRVNDAAHGLMQVLRSTAREMGWQGSAARLMEPAVNIDLGTRYLARMLAQFDGDAHLAVAAYNAGPGHVGRLVQAHGKSYEAIRPYLPAVTRDHVARTMTYGAQFRAGQTTAFACPSGAAPRSEGVNQPLVLLLIFAALWVLAGQGQ